MKKLMLGNAAIARGLYEAGCRFVSSYPGTPSTEVTEEAALYPEIYAEWAPNEKCAMEAAIGASIAGARAATAMKHVGLNVAADPLFTASYAGVNGGMVVIVADDPGMHSSQNEQDTRRHAISAKLPLLEPSDSQECRDYAKLAFTLSEQFDTPVLLRSCTRVAHSQSLVELCDREEAPLKPYEKKPQKFIMTPGNAIPAHKRVEERTLALQDWNESSSLVQEEHTDSEWGVITAGISYQYVKEALPEVNVLKLGMIHPLPLNRLIAFAKKVKKLAVVEELEPVIEEQLRAAGVRVDLGKKELGLLGEFSQNRIRQAFGLSVPVSLSIEEPLPVRPPVLCPGCPHRGLFHVLHKLKLTVTGDIGCYTLGAGAPLNAMDTTICMGASIGVLHGMNKVRQEQRGKSVAVIGDSTFIHSGLTGLINLVYNQGYGLVLILDNSITGMTGHQQNPLTGMTLQNQPAKELSAEAMVKACGIDRVQVIDPQELKSLEKAIKEELAIEEPSVIIVRRPCALLKWAKPKPAYKVDGDKCRSCKACMQIGCPALQFTAKAAIDPTLCVGCGLCRQLCHFDAIKE